MNEEDRDEDQDTESLKSRLYLAILESNEAECAKLASHGDCSNFHVNLKKEPLTKAILPSYTRYTPLQVAESMGNTKIVAVLKENERKYKPGA